MRKPNHQHKGCIFKQFQPFFNRGKVLQDLFLHQRFTGSFSSLVQNFSSKLYRSIFEFLARLMNNFCEYFSILMVRIDHVHSIFDPFLVNFSFMNFQFHLCFSSSRSPRFCRTPFSNYTLSFLGCVCQSSASVYAWTTSRWPPRFWASCFRWH